MANKKLITNKLLLNPPFLELNFNFKRLNKREIEEILSFCEIEFRSSQKKAELFNILDEQVIKNIECYREAFKIEEVPVEYRKIGDVVVSKEYFLSNE